MNGKTTYENLINLLCGLVNSRSGSPIRFRMWTSRSPIHLSLTNPRHADRTRSEATCDAWRNCVCVCVWGEVHMRNETHSYFPYCCSACIQVLQEAMKGRRAFLQLCFGHIFTQAYELPNGRCDFWHYSSVGIPTNYFGLPSVWVCCLVRVWMLRCRQRVCQQSVVVSTWCSNASCVFGKMIHRLKCSLHTAQGCIL